MNKINYKKESQRIPGRAYKHLLILIAIVTAVYPAKAIVGSYTFSQSTATYTPITGTTFVSGNWDDDTITVALPFSFLYNNIAHNQVSISSNGFVSMDPLPDIYNVCGLQASPLNTIAGYGTDLQSSTVSSNIQYGTIGTAPNRQFVVQYSDCDHYTTGAHTNHWNFQIILNETSNTIQVVWGTLIEARTMGPNTCSDIVTESGNVGLLGNLIADFNIRKITNGTDTWTTSVAGAAITDVCNMSPSNFPAVGLTYTWTPAPLVAMTYSSSTTAFINDGQSVGRNSSANQIFQVQVVTSGSLSPLSLTGLTLSTAGCTDAFSDLANSKVYFTGISNSFSAANQFGSTIANPNGTYTVNGNVVLEEGINYFWITYDITGFAGIGDTLSGCCTQIAGSGTIGSQVPSITCPSGYQTIEEIGFWTPILTAAPDTNGGVMLLLSDGTVMCKTASGGSDGIGNKWNKLTPDIHGSYVNGTWTSLTPMHDTRLYFSSQVLKDGRVYVAGGEYGTGTGTGETYNPLTNTWTLTPSTGHDYVDANSEILEDGRVLQACEWDNITFIYNPVINTYIPGPTPLGTVDESVWVKLPDNSVLFVDMGTTNSERYIPSLNQWIADANVPVQLYDPFGDETGAAFLLPDGRAFFIGDLSHTAYYTPSGNNSPGTWTAGPDIPNAQGPPDAAAAMMVDGKILCAVSPVPTSSNHFPSPTAFYEFNYLTNSFTHISAPFGGASEEIPCYITNMLDLPDGSVLYSEQGSPQYFVYTPGGQPLASGKPTISGITQNGCDLFTISGTLFNGISEGAAYGDDWQMATNYPVIRLSSGGNVYYARTTNWNSTGVQRGNAPDSTQFTLPAGLPAGTYWLVVTANGIASDSISFTTPTIPVVSFSGLPDSVCVTSGSSTLTGSPAGGIFSGSGITGNVFNPASAALGNNTITFQHSGIRSLEFT